MTPVQQILPPESLPQEPGEYMRFCPRCGAKIPENLKGCWGCGKVLDPRLIELKKAQKEAEGIAR